VPLRLFISGRASSALEARRQRLLADPNLELVERVEQADAVVSLPPAPAFAGDESSGLRGDRLEPLVEQLTGREHEVLVLLADGRSNRDIAAALAISEHTVKFHLSSIFGKLGASTRTEAVHRGLRHGVIDI
jgi:DNA-binding CsgD family transcriptional regulator